MGRKHKEKGNRIFGLANVKRCLTTALLSVAFFPVLLTASLIEPEFGREYMIPGAFFSAVSAAFAYLLWQVEAQKMKRYYDIVVWVYLTAFHLFFMYFAQTNLLFYYAAVVFAAYVVLLPVEHYVVMTVGELVCYAALIVKSGTESLPIGQLLFLAGVHLFAFTLSRDLYNTKKNFLLEEKKLRREMAEAEHDSLTGLLNRRGLEHRVDEVWQTSLNRQETVAAMVIAIDSFKTYNDRFGHVQGDVCICQVAHRIAETVQEYGLTARTIGVEFLVFMKDVSVQDTYELAEQIRSDVEKLHISMGDAGSSVITVSVGMDIRCATEDVSQQGLYGRAYTALYQAKQEGGNCIWSTQNMSSRRAKIS